MFNLLVLCFIVVTLPVTLAITINIIAAIAVKTGLDKYDDKK